jgi:hypothetical protein
MKRSAMTQYFQRHVIFVQHISDMQNEPHTRDLYEINQGLPPGQIVKNWIWEMAAYIKSIDSNHMVG